MNPGFRIIEPLLLFTINWKLVNLYQGARLGDTLPDTLQFTGFTLAWQLFNQLRERSIYLAGISPLEADDLHVIEIEIQAE